MRWNNTLLAIWLKWRSANLFPNICFVKFWMNAKVVPIWFKWREIIFLIFSRSYAVKQYSAGYLIEVEVSKLVPNICFVKFRMNAKVVPLWFKRREWNKILLAIWLKLRSANLFLNICFVNFWMNAKVVPIWFKWREINFFDFFLVSMRWKNTLLAIWLKWRSANWLPITIL